MQNHWKGLLAAGGFIALFGVFYFMPGIALAKPAEGELLLDHGTVYKVEEGYWRPFRSESVFRSHGYDFSQVRRAGTDDLQYKKDGWVMIYRDGTLVKGPDALVVYLVANGEKRGFENAPAFLGLGYDFANVKTANTETFADLPDGINIGSSDIAHPIGTLVNLNGTIYIITARGRLAFSSAEDFESYGFSFDNVVPANLADRLLSEVGVAGEREVASGGGGGGSAGVSQAPAPVPGFYVDNVKVTQVTCGQMYTFKVLNYDKAQVWLEQTKNEGKTGASDKPYSVPDTYTSVCDRDEGRYTNDVFYLTVEGGTKAGLIGSASFEIKTPQGIDHSPTVPALEGALSVAVSSSFFINAVSTDIDGGDLRYVFNWGDGTTATVTKPAGQTVTASHSWTTAGDKVIKVSVADPQGNYAEAVRLVSVTSATTGNPPKPPFNVQIQSAITTDGSAKLYWENVDGEKFYVYKNKNDGPFQFLASTTDKFYKDVSGLGQDVKYGYYVTAVNNYGESEPSQKVYILPASTGTVGALTISIDPASPSQDALVAGGSSKVTLAELKLTTSGEAVNLRSIHFTTSGKNVGTLNDEINRVYLYDGATEIASMVPTTSEAVTFQNLDGKFQIPQGSTKRLTVKIDAGTVTNERGDGYIADAGDGVSFHVLEDAYSAVGSSSGTVLPADKQSGSFWGMTFFVVKSFPRFEKLALSSNTLVNSSGVPLYKFKLVADPKGDVGFYKATFNVAPTNATVANYELVEEPGGSEIKVNVPVAVGTQVEATLGSSYRLIAAGSSKTYELRAAVSNSVSGSSVVTTVLGDTALSTSYPGIATTVDADSNDNFIWGDMHFGSISTNSVNDSQWFNGYKVPGLNAVSVAEVLTRSGGTTTEQSVFVALDSSSPLSRDVKQGETGVNFLAVKITATGKDARISNFSFYQTGTAIPSDISRLYLYDGSTLLGTSSFQSAGSGYNFGVFSTDNQGCYPNCPALVTIPAYSSKTLRILADISPNATIGATSAFKISQAGNIFTSDRLPISGSFPIVGNQMTIKSAVAQTITVLSPNGGETWVKGATQTIKWQDNTPAICPVGTSCTALASKFYDIKLVSYYPPCTGNFCPPLYYVGPYTIADSVYGSSYNWSVGKIVNYNGTIAPDGSYTVQICQTGTSICDSSDSYFKIISPPIIPVSSITVLFPNGGEAWTQGTTQTIRWNNVVSSGSEVSPYYPPVDIYIISNPTNTCTISTHACQVTNAIQYTIAKNVYSGQWTNYEWTVGKTLSGDVGPGSYTVKICNSSSSTCDSSDNYFKIVSLPAPSIQIAGSTGGQSSNSSISANIGDTFTISGVPQNLSGLSYWYGSGNPPAGYYNRAFFFDQNFGNNNSCGNNEASVNSEWTMTCTAKVPGSSAFYVEIYANGQTYRSNLVNVIVGGSTQTITVLSPNGGETWQVGQTYQIKWSAPNLQFSAETIIGLDVTTQTVAEIARVTNSGSFSFTVPASIAGYKLGGSNTYKILVSVFDGVKGAYASDRSDAPFTVVASNLPVIPSINSSFSNPSYSAGTTQARLSSFIINNPNSQSVSISSITLHNRSLYYVPVSNIKILINGQQFGQTSSNSVGDVQFSGISPVQILANGSIAVDVYGDIASADVIASTYTITPFPGTFFGPFGITGITAQLATGGSVNFSNSSVYGQNLTILVVSGGASGGGSSGAIQGTPAFYVGSSPVSSVVCGQTYTFKVDNYSGSQIWLGQTKNDQQTYNGIYSVPATYTSVCGRDEGSYNNNVYTVVNGQPGSYISSVGFEIKANVQGAFTSANQSPAIPSLNGPVSFAVGASQTFSGYSTDADGDAITYSINWGDGSPVYTVELGSGYPYIASHVWSQPGIYNLQVSASDGKGDPSIYGLLVYAK